MLLGIVLFVAGAATPPDAVANERRAAPVSFNHWYFWYHHNADRLEALVAPAGYLDGSGLAASRRPQVLEQLRTFLAERHHHQAIRANACRALGRSTSEPSDAKLLLARMRDGQDQTIVREGAALGLGLLRRSDPKLVLPAATYDEVERALIAFARDRVPSDRLRGMAILSLGLLASRPGGEAGRSRTVAFLTDTLRLRVFSLVELRLRQPIGLRLLPALPCLLC